MPFVEYKSVYKIPEYYTDEMTKVYGTRYGFPDTGDKYALEELTKWIEHFWANGVDKKRVDLDKHLDRLVRKGC